MKKKGSSQSKPKGNAQSGAQKKRNNQQNFVKSTKVKKFDKNDPVKYDFALFGMGIDEYWQ